MLTAAEVRQSHRRRRSPYSDKQHYQEYILQRIEGYKNSIGRDELLRLGDEAASELQATSEGQFVLTEVLMLESVDRLIMKRLSLRPYRRWRQQFLKLRAAQRTPTHWGIDANCPLTPLLPRIEPEDTALVIGTKAAPMTFLLAAHDAAVTFLADDLGCVERVESKMAEEALSSVFESFVTQLDQPLPAFMSFLAEFDILVLDPHVLADLSVRQRAKLIRDLQQRSRASGVHIILPTCSALSPDALRGLYEGWTQEEELKRRRRADSKGGVGLILCKPACPPDTD
jgi:hypothetical protein